MGRGGGGGLLILVCVSVCVVCVWGGAGVFKRVLRKGGKKKEEGVSYVYGEGYEGVWVMKV